MALPRLRLFATSAVLTALGWAAPCLATDQSPPAEAPLPPLVSALQGSWLAEDDSADLAFDGYGIAFIFDDSKTDHYTFEMVEDCLPGTTPKPDTLGTSLHIPALDQCYDVVLTDQDMTMVYYSARMFFTTYHRK